MIIVHFKKHFQSPFEDVNTDFSVAMEEFLCLNKNAKKLACFQYLSIVGFDVGERPFSEIRRSFYRPISIMRFLRFRLTDHKKIDILYDIVYGWSLNLRLLYLI